MVLTLGHASKENTSMKRHSRTCVEILGHFHYVTNILQHHMYMCGDF